MICLISIYVLMGCSISKGKDIEKEKTLEWKWVIEPGKYKDIKVISDNHLAVQSDNGWGILSETGEEILPIQYDCIFSFCDDKCLVEKENVYFYIDVTGTPIFEHTYENAYSFSEGKAAICNNGKWGFIDQTGEVIISCMYDEVKSFSEGKAAVCIDSKWGFIDGSGKTITKICFDEVHSYSEKRAIVKKNGSYNVIDEKGCELAVAFYDEILDYSEDYAACKQGEKWGFINTHGIEVIPCMYDSVKSFHEGKAAVNLYFDDLETSKWAYIDQKGEIVIDYRQYIGCEGRMNYVGDFTGGVAFVSLDSYEVMDSDGNFLSDSGTPFFVASCLSYDVDYDVIPGYTYEDETMKKKRYGLFGKKGEQRVEPVFDYIYGTYGKYVKVSHGEIDGGERIGIIEIF